MVSNPQLQQSDMSRVWLTQFGAAPNRVPTYEGLARVDSINVPLGDLASIQVPNPDRYRQFNIVGVVLGDAGLPTASLMFRLEIDKRSAYEKYVKNRCTHDLQVHFGLCQDPQDFNGGWESAIILEDAAPTNYDLNAIGALQPDQRAMSEEDIPFTGQRVYFIRPLVFQEQAAAEVVQEIVGIIICDAATCGACGVPSEGCDIVFAVTLSNAGSPGLPAELIFTENGGTDWLDTLITTLAANEDPNGLACIGANVVVISEDSDSLHYAPIAGILNGSEVWTEVTTGFVATNGPLAIWSETVRHTWIVAENGYIYFTADPTQSVLVQSPGDVTTNNLNDVHAFSIEDVVAVGDSNTVMLTRDGGDTWVSITGPAPAVDLNTVWMQSVNEWLIGTAGGQLFFTLDAGVNWTEKVFPGSGAGVVRDIQFSSKSVGYMSHDTAVPAGRILRTIDGGNSWFITPQALNIAMPANDQLNAIAACMDDQNIVYAGGLGDDATDGIIVKGAG